MTSDNVVQSKKLISETHNTSTTLAWVPVKLKYTVWVKERGTPETFSKALVILANASSIHIICYAYVCTIIVHREVGMPCWFLMLIPNQYFIILR